MDTILNVIQLTKGYHRRTAVRQVSFQVQRGEILGIVGESGCGKSTIAKLITRLIDADAGKIYLKGKDITHIRGKEGREIYKEIQMIFQNPKESFNPRHQLGSAILEGMINQGIPKQIARQRMFYLLRECGLQEEYANRYPHEVSLGECQRAAIARALAIKPSLLICDEATSALDVTVQSKIIELLLRLQTEENLTILFISHDLALVQQFCHRVLVMYEGRMIEEGIPDEIIQKPKKEYTKKLIEAVYDL
jgi:ABC-type oligopeptide transport system ATPase subunit